MPAGPRAKTASKELPPDSNFSGKHPAGTAAPGESRLVIGILTPYTTPLLFSIPGAFLISGTMASREGLPRLAPGGEAPLLVLVSPEQQTLEAPALEEGARSCLILPIHPEEVTCTLAPRGQATTRADTRWILAEPRRTTRDKRTAARLNSPFGLGKK